MQSRERGLFGTTCSGVGGGIGTATDFFINHFIYLRTRPPGGFQSGGTVTLPIPIAPPRPHHQLQGP